MKPNCENCKNFKRDWDKTKIGSYSALSLICKNFQPKEEAQDKLDPKIQERFNKAFKPKEPGFETETMTKSKRSPIGEHLNVKRIDITAAPLEQIHACLIYRPRSFELVRVADGSLRIFMKIGAD